MTSKSKKVKIPMRYLPSQLTNSDKKKQFKMLAKSKKMYKSHKYFTRKQLSSYTNKPSKHIIYIRIISLLLICAIRLFMNSKKPPFYGRFS